MTKDNTHEVCRASLSGIATLGGRLIRPRCAAGGESAAAPQSIGATPALPLSAPLGSQRPRRRQQLAMATALSLPSMTVLSAQIATVNADTMNPQHNRTMYGSYSSSPPRRCAIQSSMRRRSCPCPNCHFVGGAWDPCHLKSSGP